ncbi:hypothetical protein H257_05291 [Aphanomyces astaci]|uniref:Uncharacterized protein n=2 Tax=Aphanomyces astaci TaxID=112090 RepID=W4GPM3_APHAT|nr:hypothetical protein H257_05291 [Aphanomyces astaci]ETV81675.1 hypothetical protein H257_05291 [Aphanomyces astaci]RQM27932.1 hypothetical protein B5M09_011533 [Aphanomyces astaci]|eukprot:XP_009828412.1 hypothetical protein H257_05291 [Aphanomyces astaci]
MQFTTLVAILSMVLLAVTAHQDSQSHGAVGFPVGPPGTDYFVKANANAVDKANNEQAASNHFANHVDSSAGNQGLRESVVFTKDRANAVANDRGFNDAIVKNDVVRKYDANQVAKGAVFFARRQLGDDDLECGGGCGGGCGGCGGYVDAPIPPSGFNNAKQSADSLNKADSLNAANQGRASDAHKRADSKRVEKHNVDLEGFAEANAKSKSGAQALSKGNFFSKRQVDQARGVTQNNGLFFRRVLRGSDS